jgi:hypothetical protein
MKRYRIVSTNKLEYIYIHIFLRSTERKSNNEWVDFLIVYIYDDRHIIIARCVNHDSMFIQISHRASDCTIRHALISVIGDETHIDIHIRRKVSFHLLFNLHSKKTHDGCDLAFKIKKKKGKR